MGAGCGGTGEVEIEEQILAEVDPDLKLRIRLEHDLAAIGLVPHRVERFVDDSGVHIAGSRTCYELVRTGPIGHAPVPGEQLRAAGGDEIGRVAAGLEGDHINPRSAEDPETALSRQELSISSSASTNMTHSPRASASAVLRAAAAPP